MLSLSKGIESLPLTLTNSIYFFNSNSKILDISTINSVRSNNLSFKYQRFTPSDCKDLGIRIFEFVAKTQFLTPMRKIFIFV